MNLEEIDHIKVTLPIPENAICERNDCVFYGCFVRCYISRDNPNCDNFVDKDATIRYRDDYFGRFGDLWKSQSIVELAQKNKN